MRFSKISLKTHLYVVALIPVILVSVFFMVTMGVSIIKREEGDVVIKAQVLAKKISGHMSMKTVISQKQKSTDFLCAAVQDNPRLAYISVRDLNNQIIVRCPASISGLDNSIVLSESALFLNDTSKSEVDDVKRAEAGTIEVASKVLSYMDYLNKEFFIEVLVLTLLGCVIGVLLVFIFMRKIAKVMGSLTNAAKRLSNGDFNISFDETHGGDVGMLQSSFLTMASTATMSRSKLEHLVFNRTLALQKQKKHTDSLNSQRKKLIEQINHSIENDRRKIAIDLHDTTNTVVLSILGNARKLKNLLSKEEALSSNPDCMESIESIEKNSNYLYTLSRDLVTNLRPEVLDEFGLGEALQDLVNTQKKINPGCVYKYSVCANFPKLSYDFNIVVYRLIQESFSNIIKYSQAKTCVVTLSCTLQDESISIRLQVVDDGIGFNPDQVTSGSGILGMRERAESVRGSLTIMSSKNCGAKLEFKYDGSLDYCEHPLSELDPESVN